MTALTQLIPKLRRDCQNLLTWPGLPSEARLRLEENLPSLELADAFLVKKRWLQTDDLPLQIAVVGPTQVGKSTVVNLLLGEELASVSPLAGWTVHAHAFLEGVHEAPWLEALFPGYEVVPSQGVSRHRLQQIGLTPIPRRPKRPCILWDTPDFDSLRAKQYQPAVLRTVGWADLVVVVVSKEKYADESVWQFLGLIEPLGQPLIICLNKVREAQREILESAFKQQWEKHFGKRPCRLLLLPYCEDPTQLEAEGKGLRRVVEELSRRSRRQPERIERALADRYLERWLEPQKRQREAISLWHKWLEEVEREAIAIYRRDFLDHLYLYDTVQRVMAELLILLEVPGIARPMFYFRRALTWPFRWLKGSKERTTAAQELTVLRHCGDHLLLSLQKRLLEHQPHPLAVHLFRAWAERLQERRSSLKARFEQAVAHYYETFQPQVEQTATELYQKLKERPTLLNSLRASRTFADAATLAMVIQTSGIGPHDFVLAPTLLAFTSLLAESALDKFLDQKIAQLKKKQLAHVEALFRQNLLNPLKVLSQQSEVPTISIERDAQHPKARYGLFLFGH